MRLLQVIDSLAPGGAERSLVATAPYLLQADIELSVAVLHERPGLQAELTTTGTRLLVGGDGSRRENLKWLRRTLEESRPDLVHTTLFEADVLGRIAARSRRIPVVSSFVNTSYGEEHRQDPGVGTTSLRAARALDMITARVVRRFHAVSYAVADTMSQRLRVPRDRVDVVWRGRDRRALGERTEKRRRAARARFDVDDETRVLVMLSRHEADKGIDVAISAVERALPNVDSARLLVAGRTGNATTRLRDQIAAAGLEHVVTLLGPRDDTAELLCAGDVFLAPSRREGLPGAVLEAMALEIPVVGSDIPSVLEAVGDEANALLVPVGDAGGLAAAIVDTLRDPRTARARAARARARFDACFTVERSAHAMIDFYRRALEEPR